MRDIADRWKDLPECRYALRRNDTNKHMTDEARRFFRYVILSNPWVAPPDLSKRYGIHRTSAMNLINGARNKKRQSLQHDGGLHKSEAYFTEAQMLSGLPTYSADELTGEELAIFRGKVKNPTK